MSLKCWSRQNSNNLIYSPTPPCASYKWYVQKTQQPCLKNNPRHKASPTASNQSEIHFPSHIILIKSQISTCPHRVQNPSMKETHRNMNQTSIVITNTGNNTRLGFTFRAQKMQESSMHLCVVSCRKLLRKMSRCQRTCNRGEESDIQHTARQTISKTKCSIKIFTDYETHLLSQTS